MSADRSLLVLGAQLLLLPLLLAASSTCAACWCCSWPKGVPCCCCCWWWTELLAAEVAAVAAAAAAEILEDLCLSRTAATIAALSMGTTDDEEALPAGGPPPAAAAAAAAAAARGERMLLVRGDNDPLGDKTRGGVGMRGEASNGSCNPPCGTSSFKRLNRGCCEDCCCCCACFELRASEAATDWLRDRERCRAAATSTSASLCLNASLGFASASAVFAAIVAAAAFAPATQAEGIVQLDCRDHLPPSALGLVTPLAGPGRSEGSIAATGAGAVAADDVRGASLSAAGMLVLADHDTLAELLLPVIAAKEGGNLRSTCVGWTRVIWCGWQNMVGHGEQALFLSSLHCHDQF